MKRNSLANFKKAVAMFVALTMLLATMISAFPVLAETTTAYNGELFDLKGAGGNFGTITGFSTKELVEGLQVHNTSLAHTTGYTDLTDKYFYWDCIGNNGSYKTLEADEGINLSSDGALMFYVKLAPNQGKTKVYFKFESFAYNAEGDNTRTYHWDTTGAANRDFYLLELGDTNWQSFKTEALGTTGDNKNAPAVVLPTGYEGWVRVPVAKYQNASKLATQRVHRVDFFFDNLTTETAYLGAVMAVDNANENLTEINFGETVYNIVDYAAYKATALNATEFAGNDLYSLNTEDTSNAQTVGLFDKGNSINLSVNSEVDASKTYYSDKYYTADYATTVAQGGGNVIRGTSGWATFGWATLPTDYTGNKGFTFSAATAFAAAAERKNHFDIALKQNNADAAIVWDSTRSFMMYVKSTGTSANKLAVEIDGLFPITTAEKSYYLLANNSTKWTEGTMTAEYSGSYGYFEIPAGFEGYVRIPCSAFLSAGKEKTGTFKRIKVYPRYLGGDYGVLTVGGFSTVDSINNLYFIYSGNSVTDFAGNKVSADLFDEMVSYDVAVSGGAVTSSTLASFADVEATTLKDGEGIMFYAKTTDAANIKLALSKTNITVDGFAYSYIEYNGLWTNATSTDGTIALPANFEGWVKLSANAFTGTDVDRVAIGFANTSVCELSNFSIINQASLDLDYIIVNGKKQSLFVELYDANADGDVDARDIVRIKKFVAQVDGIKVSAYGADVNRVEGVNATDISAIRRYILNGPEENISEVAVSRYLAQEGYTTAANYESSTATVENVNF